MPWYWTDDLARNLIDAGKVDQSKVSQWLSSPVAIRRAEADTVDVAVSLLEEESEPPSLAAAA